MLTFKLLCGYDPKNITIDLYLFLPGAKKQPLSYCATLIFPSARCFYVMLEN